MSACFREKRLDRVKVPGGKSRLGGGNGVGRDAGPREARSDGFNKVYKMGAQGVLGTLTSLLDRLAWDWT